MTNETHTPPALYLILDLKSSPDPMPEIRAAKAAGPVLSLLINSSDQQPDQTLISNIQALDIAVILETPELITPLRADGLHLGEDKLEAFQAAAHHLQNDEILGVMASHSRHNAMLLAEQGASYIAFDTAALPGGASEQDQNQPSFENQQPPTISWWTDLFETPAVAWDVKSEAEALTATAGGADFIALTPAFWQQGEKTGQIITALCKTLTAGKTTSA